MKSKCIYVLILLIVCVSIMLQIPLTVLAASNVVENEYIYVEMDTAVSYSDYLLTKKDAVYPTEPITIKATDIFETTADIKIYKDFEGMDGESLFADEEGYVEWIFNVETTGFYQLKVDYYPIAGKSASISRSVMIDGELPFSEARTVNFSRIWADVKQGERAILSDSRGNDIRPEQIEVPVWTNDFVKDSVGYEEEPLFFWLEKGVHKLRFDAVREPILIHKLTFCQQEKALDYKSVLSEYENTGYSNGTGKPIKYQAEEISRKSDSMIVAASDRSSASIEPSDPVKYKLNVISGENMKQTSQWVAWDFTVPTTGLYTISFKARQNTSNGSISSRRILIDGKLPFEELKAIEFPYSTHWEMRTLGDEEGNYKFYLEAGQTHELRMDVVLGENSEFIRKVKVTVDKLNRLYREILVVTGPTPDVNRDYQFDKMMPEVLVDLKTEYKQLYSVYDELTKKVGMSGETVQILVRSADLIKKMCDNPESIAESFSDFQSNITSLASWVTNSLEQPLSLDYFIVAPVGAELPKISQGFWTELKYHVGSFISSFFNDYNVFSAEESESNVTVWVGSGMTGGRDQAQILRNMVNNYFTPNSKINVNISLVSMGALLPATLANRGPDVALSLSAAEVGNYAFRSALKSLTGMNDFAEIKERFHESALSPLTFQNEVYGLPETQTYPMMFYRKDILSELNIDIPQTWDDVIRILPILQKKQLNFGLPSASGTGTTLTAYSMLLYQNGGALYTTDGAKSTVNTDEGLEAFSFLTMLYNDYNIPQVIDFANRFRSGAVPIGIADYSMYNQLSVFAPELEGIWEFTAVPGIRQEDGTINRSIPASVTSCVLMNKAKNPEKAWEFMKWWTDSEAQVKFGRELESILGTAARYPTANKEAVYQIPWSKSHLDDIMNAGEWAVGIPEVPGGYYTARYIDFAFRDVVNMNLDAGEALSEAEISINFELTTKRKEFGLPVQ